MEPQPAKLFSGEKVTVPQRWAAGTASSPEKEEMQHLADPSWGRQHCSSRHKEDTLNPLLIRLHFKLTGQNKAKNEVCKKEKERDLTICDHFLQHQVAFCCLNSCGMLLVWCLWGFVYFFPLRQTTFKTAKKKDINQDLDDRVITEERYFQWFWSSCLSKSNKWTKPAKLSKTFSQSLFHKSQRRKEGHPKSVGLLLLHRAVYWCF